MVDKFPEQVFIVDHIAKPKIAQNEMEPWAGRMRELAKRPNVYCKISGMETEADWRGGKRGVLRPYFETVLEAFTQQRLMFGSDWPVCLLATGYGKWVQTVREWLAPLSATERERIWGGTAVEAYAIKGEA